MKLLHVTPSFYPAHLYGGPVVSLHRLACAQVRAGLDVRVLTSAANGPGQDLRELAGTWTDRYGVPTYYARVTARQDFSLELALRLPPLLRWAELVHVTAVFSPTSMIALAQAAAWRPVVVSPRGSLLPWAVRAGGRRKRAVLAALRPLLRRVAGWHVTSEEEAAALRDLGCVGPGRPVSLIENGVDLEAPCPALPPVACVGADEGPVVVMLGRIDPVKGLDLAVAALAELRREHPRAVLVLAGPDRDGHGAAVRAEAARRGLAGAVRFPGLVVDRDKAALLRRADALWLCSKMESFGNVVLEALAAGTPVVAVQTTPWRWLEQAGAGRWVPPGPGDVAAATRELLTRDAGLRERCRAAVTERFAWPVLARRMSALYAAAITG